MTPELQTWLDTYVALVRAADWDGLVEHLRVRVNVSKEVLLSVDPEMQRSVHNALDQILEVE